MRVNYVVVAIAVWGLDAAATNGQDGLNVPALQWEGRQLTFAMVTKLNEPVSPKDEWKRGGFATPQQTLETFMWALREQDAETYRACINAPEELPIESWKKLKSDVYALQCLAVRTAGEDNLVELKFRWAVLAHGKQVLAHRFQRIGDDWKLDLTSSTYEPNW